MRVLFSGQKSFENRGCEAIVRSTVALLREQYPSCEILIPSTLPEWDARQWPEAAQNGISFVRGYFPAVARYWRHVQRFPIRSLKQADWPFLVSKSWKEAVRSVDLVMAIGGDNYSLDYDIPSLYVATDDVAMRLGKPVVLWGASVGPFEREPAYVPVIRQHLSKMAIVGVREEASSDYLKGTLALENVLRMSDPAFGMRAESLDVTGFWPAEGREGVVGLNVSPLIAKRVGSRDALRAIAVDTVRSLCARGHSVILVPHVFPASGDSISSDVTFLREVAASVGSMGGRVTLIEDSLNAAQLKCVIGRCRFFIGARTHATIAALSQSVPTLSIAYSVKARGLNQDLFGSQDAVLGTELMSADAIMERVEWLVANEDELRRTLAGRVPELIIQNQTAMRAIDGVLARGS